MSRTKGPYEVVLACDSYRLNQKEKPFGLVCATIERDNMDFVRSCYDVASQLDSQGINGEEAIKRLLEIVRRLQNVWDFWNDGEVVNDYIRVKRETMLSNRIGDILSLLYLKPESERKE